MIVHDKRKYFTIIFSILVFLFFAIIINLLKYKNLEKSSFNAVFNPLYHLASFLESSLGLANSRAGTSVNSHRYGLIDIGSNFSKAILKNKYPPKLKEIKLNINFKNWEQIVNDRNKAMVIGINRNPKWVPSLVEIENENIKAKVRLKGNTADHWFWPKRWSLRVELKGSSTFMGMKKFSLQRVGSRQFPADYLFQTWHRYLGGLAPRFNFVKVSVNGNNWGTMMMEEGLSKHFLEHAKRKDSPLLKLISKASEGGYFYTANKVYENKSYPKVFYSKMDNYKPVLISTKQMLKNNQQIDRFSYLKNQLEKLHNEEIKSVDIFNIKSLILPCILSNVWGTKHTLASQNTRYYFNPYTLLIEPITSDQTRIKPLLKVSDIDCVFPFSEIFTYKTLNHEVEKIFKNIELSIPKLKVWHNEVCINFPIDCPNLDLNIIKDNFYKIKNFYMANKDNLNIKNELFINKQTEKPKNHIIDDKNIDYPEYIYAEHFDNGEIIIFNYLSKSVRIEEIHLKCRSKKSKKCKNVNLLKKPLILKGSKNDNKELSKLIYKTKTQNLGTKRYFEIVTSRNNNHKKNIIHFTLKRNIYNPSKSEYFYDLQKLGKIKVVDNKAIISSGILEIKNPLILPKKINLIIKPGANLYFEEKAYILIEGSLIAKGSYSNPIKFKARNKGWQGILVKNSLEKSYLHNVLIEDVRAIRNNPLYLTSAITFFNSNVEMSNVKFNRSYDEDALNIVQSEFLLNDIVFKNNISDSLDIDFSEGSVNNALFENVKGDAIDVSGSDVKLNNVICNSIKDKCISIGEKSILTAVKVLAKKSGTAVASKDGSYGKIVNLTVLEQKGISAMTYNKKSGYGNASLIIKNTNLSKLDSRSSFETYLEINDKLVQPEKINVKKLYKNEQMRKFKNNE